MRQTPRLNRKRQETLTGDSDGTLASARLLDEDRVFSEQPQIFTAGPNPRRGLQRPGQCGWRRYLPPPRWRAWRACLNLLCGKRRSPQPNVTTSGKKGPALQCPCRAAQTRKINTAGRGKGRLLGVRGAAGRRCETGKPSCFGNLNALLLGSSNMCLHEGAITPFQDLAFCINIDQRNVTHRSHDVRLISIKC